MGQHRYGYNDRHINYDSIVLFIKREMQEKKGVLYNSLNPAVQKLL